MKAYSKLQLGFYFNDMRYLKKVNIEIMETASEVIQSKILLSMKIMEQMESKIITPDKDKKLIL
jgi:hypothetical protein